MALPSQAKPSTSALRAMQEAGKFLHRMLLVRLAIRALALNAELFARVMLGWIPDPKQAAVLLTGARTVVMNCSRQWGKTMVAATKMLHLALTRPGSVCVIVAENLGQTDEVFLKIDEFLARLGIPAERGTGKVARVLPNGSRILGIAAREAGVRGYTADFVFVDEAARLDDEAIDALLPLTAIRNGDWWMSSTPWGRRGRFYEAWAYEDDGALKVSATWKENPRLPEGFIERVRRLKGDTFVEQEFECQFVENGRFLVNQDHVDGIME